MSRLRVRAALGALATTLACAGCGFGPGAGSSAVSLRVTENFGSTPIKTVDPAKVTGSETDMQLLEHHFSVKTRYGGGFVESIDGHSGTSHRYDWFYYVNGIQAKKGAAATNVDKGDHIWFDLHDWAATESIPDVVGSFPEPFLSGTGGQRYPSTIECGSHVKAACSVVSREFRHLHIPLSPAGLGYGSGTDSLSINVGTWKQLSPQVAAELVKYGPGASGVYAHFSSNGRRIMLDNEAGKVVRTLGPDSGLIAAVGDAQAAVPTWLVAGTDPAGVMAAARAVTPQALADHFALAVHGSTRYPVPLTGSS